VEEGTPEEIFDHPKKDKTRRFIHHLHVFEMSIQRAGFDTARLFSGIEQFSSRHMISRRLTNRMLTLAEELFIQTVLPGLRAQDEFHLVFEVGGTDGSRVEMTLTYRGEDSDPMRKEDEISLAIIRNACEEIEYFYEEGLCTVKARL
jgi:polar amino acid transport system ATP-binding protein